METRSTHVKGITSSIPEEQPEQSINAVSGLIENHKDMVEQTPETLPLSMPTTVITTLLERFEKLMEEIIKTNKKDRSTPTLPEVDSAENTTANISNDVTTDIITQSVLPTQTPITHLSPSLFNKFYPAKITPRFVEQAIDQLEAWFNISNIHNDNERYQILKLSIEPETYQQVASLINNPPETNKYHTLKNAIIKTFTDSEAKRIKSLLNDVELGDRRPSQLLSEMSTLYKGPRDRIFSELFISRLPSTVRGILMGMKPTNTELEPPLETIAQWADSILEQLDKKERINDVHPSHNTGKLENMLDGLTESINAFHKRNNYQTPFSQKFNNNRSRPQTQRGTTPNMATHNENSEQANIAPQGNRPRRDDSIEKHTMCWYHRTFGRDARSCRTPCTQHPKN